MFLIRMFQKPRRVEHLMNDDDFHEAIDHERMRVDRNGSRFSLVAFDCPPREHDSLSRQLSRICRQRLRNIDRVGFLSSGEVGLLLPETDAVGACKVADDIKRSLSLKSDSLTQRIYAYPEKANCGISTSTVQLTPAAIQSADQLLVEPLPL